jgi:hypothetical protein
MSDLPLGETVELGSNAGRGNLLGVQPYMVANDYASEEAFYARLDSYMQAAGQKGWLGDRTVVVWPEQIGTWLIAAGESQAVFRAPTLHAAMRPLVLRHIFPFAARLVSAREKDRVIASLFRMKAEQMAGLYQAAFSRLARRYAVTVVAGSIFLPSPQVQQGKVVAGRGPIYNTSTVFRPDGLAHGELARKSYPISTEQSFVAAAPIAELPVFDTPAGRLGVVVCADSWYPQIYDRLKAGGAEFIAVPSLSSFPQIWDKPWGGYISADPPQDADWNDVGKITEGQAWLKYALAGRIGRSGARCGVNVFLHGKLWDLGTDNGNSVGVRGDEIVEVKKEGGALINLWL